MKIKRILLALFVVIAGGLLTGIAVTPENSQLLFPYNKKDIVDSHVHVAGLGFGDSSCFINEEMKKNYRFGFYLRAMGVTIDELEKSGDQIVFEKISRAVESSQSIGRAVILSLDGVVDKNGHLDELRTQVYVPNDYVKRETQKYPNLLYGASINPYRNDAIKRLEKAARDGAVLLKWIPSIMYIDPADEALIPFYQKMIELQIPLLTHTGMERSFSNARDELADPLRLKLPLDLGVTVIAAHIATTGESQGEDNFERILPIFQQYPNLYADISSLTQINKRGLLSKALAAEELKGRLIYGTDWPLQFFPLVSAWFNLDEISLSTAKTISSMENQWDRDVALKAAMGVSADIFYGGKKVIKIDSDVLGRR